MINPEANPFGHAYVTKEIILEITSSLDLVGAFNFSKCCKKIHDCLYRCRLLAERRESALKIIDKEMDDRQYTDALFFVVYPSTTDLSHLSSLCYKTGDTEYRAIRAKLKASKRTRIMTTIIDYLDLMALVNLATSSWSLHERLRPMVQEKRQRWMQMGRPATARSILAASYLKTSLVNVSNVCEKYKLPAVQGILRRYQAVLDPVHFQILVSRAWEVAVLSERYDIVEFLAGRDPLMPM